MRTVDDELGYMELDRRGAEMLFQVLTEREETNSVAIASNESFSGWTKTFTDPRLCAAIVDRLTFGGTSSKRHPVLPPRRHPRPTRRLSARRRRRAALRHRSPPMPMTATNSNGQPTPDPSPRETGVQQLAEAKAAQRCAVDGAKGRRASGDIGGGVPARVQLAKRPAAGGSRCGRPVQPGRVVRSERRDEDYVDAGRPEG